ncbi:MAG: DUF2156 domain-containing protein [Planctomycetaceae bacterium]|nr:DUF2156 domain-containing protein [Planctomycetaceae bacterium]
MSLGASTPNESARRVDSAPPAQPFASEGSGSQTLSLMGRRLRIDRGTESPVEPAAPVVKPALHEPVTEAVADLEQFVFRHGQYFDSYLATEPGRMLFWSRNRQGLISYTRRGRYVLVGGGLIAPEIQKETLLREFVEFAHLNKWRLAFHNIGDHELPLFSRLGFQVTKWGEEPVIDLANCTWGGKAFEWVRRQSSYCKRHGVVAYEVRPERLEPEQWHRTMAEINEVTAESLSIKAQSDEMHFFEGRIHDHDLGLRRLFLARSENGTGRLEGFVICNPMQGGQMWSTELYRHRLDSVRGTIAYLFHHLMQQMQQEGVRQVGLCLDPGLGVETGLPGDSVLVRKGFQFGEKYLGFVFDVVGLRHFKTRFRPDFENRYVCVWPKVTIGSLLAFGLVFGGFNLNIPKIARILAMRVRKRVTRRNLAAAE